METNKIRSIRMTIEPSFLPDSYNARLDVTINYSGKTVTTQELMPRDDFDCLFDRLVDKLRHDIKHVLNLT